MINPNDEFVFSITLRDNNGEYTIKTRENCEVVDSVFENLIIPILLAAGYYQESIDRYMDSNNGN